MGFRLYRIDLVKNTEEKRSTVEGGGGKTSDTKRKGDRRRREQVELFHKNQMKSGRKETHVERSLRIYSLERETVTCCELSLILCFLEKKIHSF